MRVLVTGSRKWTDREAVAKALDKYWHQANSKGETLLRNGRLPTGCPAFSRSHIPATSHARSTAVRTCGRRPFFRFQSTDLTKGCPGHPTAKVNTSPAKALEGLINPAKLPTQQGVLT